MDDFSQFSSGLNSPALNAMEITPSDAVDLEKFTRSIYVGEDGDLRVTFVGGTTVTLFGVRAGVAYPFRLSRVWATGTTAGSLVGLR